MSRPRTQNRDVPSGTIFFSGSDSGSSAGPAIATASPSRERAAEPRERSPTSENRAGSDRPSAAGCEAGRARAAHGALVRRARASRSERAEGLVFRRERHNRRPKSTPALLNRARSARGVCRGAGRPRQAPLGQDGGQAARNGGARARVSCLRVTRRPRADTLRRPCRRSVACARSASGRRKRRVIPRALCRNPIPLL